jgi:hypothetical protein
MKHFLCLLVLTFSISGCNIFGSDPNQLEVKEFKVVDVQITSGETFVYNLGLLGDEEQALIKEDSKHAFMSELAREFNESATVEYRYQSKTDFTGNDTVVLEVRRGSDGASPNREIYITVLQLHIQPYS